MYEIGFVVAIIMGIAQLVKGYIPAKFIPLFTMFLGIVAGIVYLPHETIQAGVMQGIVIALSANGLYDVTGILHTEKAE